MNTGLLLISEDCKNFITKLTCHLFKVTFLKSDIIQLFIKFKNFKKGDLKILHRNNFENSSYNEII